MVRAFHAIIAAYGFWLPNDPRGSWSDWVRNWELRKFGPATKVTTRRSVASADHDRQQRLAAKRLLKLPRVKLSGLQARAVAQGFAQAAAEASYVIWACAIMPEHTHLVIERHQRNIEQIVRHLKGSASRLRRSEGLHPLADFSDEDSIPSPWSRGCWRVFLRDRAAISRAIEYVERNPEKEGKRRQTWSFVKAFSGQ